MDRFITSVSLEDPFFARRTVRVIPRADFATDQIESINVSLDYDGVVKNVVLDAAAEEQTVEWQSSLEGGRMRAPVDGVVRGAVRDAPRRPPAPDRGVDRRRRRRRGRRSPRATAPATRSAGSASPSSTSRGICTARSRCTAPTSTRRTASTSRNQYGLTDGAERGRLAGVRTRPGEAHGRLPPHPARRRRPRLGQRRPDHRHRPDPDHRSLRQQAGASMSSRRRRCSARSSTGSSSTCDTTTTTNDIHKRESFELSAADTATKRFTVELADQTKRRVTFKVSMLRIDGIVIDIPESTTELDRIIVTPQMRGHRTVTRDHRRGRLRRQRHPRGHRRDAVRAGRARPAVRRRPSPSRPIAPRAPFEYDFAEGDPDFTYRVIHTLENGLTRESATRTSSSDRVLATVD